jgi:hypothetical protein
LLVSMEAYALYAILAWGLETRAGPTRQRVGRTS